MGRFGSARCLVAGLVVLGAVSSTVAAPRRVTSEGITYAVDLSAPGSGEADFVLLDPGRQAWLAPAWETAGHPSIRFGSGMQFYVVGDSRVSEHAGFLFFECEALGSRSFEEAADQFANGLRSLWDRVGVELKALVSTRDDRLKVLRETVPCRRVLQEVTRRDNGWQRDASTILFPWNQRLVAVTAYGGSDLCRAVIKDLAKARNTLFRKGHVHHVADAGGSPYLFSFFVVALPAGYRVAPVPADLDDPTLVARWELPAAGTETPATTLTLRRLRRSMPPDREAAVNAAVKELEERQAKVEERKPIDVDGHDGVSFAYTVGEGDGTVRGVAAIWPLANAVYGMFWEGMGPTAADDEVLVRAALGDLRTWSADVKR